MPPIRSLELPKMYCLNTFSKSFLTSFWNPFFGCEVDPRGLLEPTCTILGPKLRSKIDQKSSLFPIQEPTYLKTAEKAKISFPPQRGAHFVLPRGSQNPPKIDGKSIPRAFYVKLVFFDTSKIASRALPGRLLEKCLT